jgi:hypothetical protein
MEEKNVASWERFIEGLDEVRKERASSTEYVQNSPLLFRGQGNSCWQLGATLERKRERMLYKDYYRIISKDQATDRDFGRRRLADSLVPRS